MDQVWVRVENNMENIKAETAPAAPAPAPAPAAPAPAPAAPAPAAAPAAGTPEFAAWAWENRGV